MTEILLTIFFISVLLIFLGSGIWVAISMVGVSSIGMMLFTTRPVGDAMATTIWGASSSWTLTALPLFVWMGEILFRTKLSENLFEGLSPWMQKLPGGLVHVNVVGCALFALWCDCPRVDSKTIYCWNSTRNNDCVDLYDICNDLVVNK